MNEKIAFAKRYCEVNRIDYDLDREYINYLTTLIYMLNQPPAKSQETREQIILFLDRASNDRTLTIPYDYISYFIYHNDIEYDAENLERFFNSYISYVEIKLDSNSKILAILAKIKRHIQLAIYQKEYIKKHVADANEKAIEVEKVADSISTKIDRLQSKIYTNFITILGVFTAIIVTVFGSFSAISDAVKKYQSSTEYLFLITTGLFFIAVLIYTLFTWIERIKKQGKSLSPLLGLLLLGISSVISYLLTLL